MFALAFCLSGACLAQTDVTPLTRYESKYYIIETNLPIARAEFIGTVMDATGKEYDRLFQGFTGVVREKQRVRVFAEREQYVAELERVSYAGNVEFTGGLFNGADGIVYTFEQDRLGNALRHECFHQFAAKVIGGRLPPWANEGLAEYFEDGTFIQGPDRLRVGDVPAWRGRVLREAWDQGLLLDVNKLLTLSGHAWIDNMSGPVASVQYSQAWALCHLMIHADGGRYAGYFDKFLGDIDKGADGELAFKKAFGPDVAPLQVRYDAYLDDIINGRIVRRE